MIVFSMSKAEPLVDLDNKVCLWNFYFNGEDEGIYESTSIGVSMKNGNLKSIKEWSKEDVEKIGDQVIKKYEVERKLIEHIETLKKQPKPIPDFNFKDME